MKKVGFFGGTFNPIHLGHLAIAQMAQEKFGLDKVIFIPAPQPPHKALASLATAQDRYNLVRLAIAGNPRFEISDVEMRREGKSYTVDTLRYFRGKLGKNVKMYFIIGADALAALHTWKYIDEVLELATFIVVNRPGYKDTKKIKHLSVTKPGIDISSSYLRERIHKRKSIRYLVPEAVFYYIEKHKLYHQRSVSTISPSRKAVL